jgi:hypothetical protein
MPATSTCCTCHAMLLHDHACTGRLQGRAGRSHLCWALRSCCHQGCACKQHGTVSSGAQSRCQSTCADERWEVNNFEAAVPVQPCKHSAHADCTAGATDNVFAVQALPLHHLVTSSYLHHAHFCTGCTFVDAGLAADGPGTCLDFDNCHISGSYLGGACIRFPEGGSGTLRRCTVQVGYNHLVPHTDVQHDHSCLCDALCRTCAGT